MEEMQAQAEHVGTKVEWDHISRWTLRGARSGFWVIAASNISPTLW